MKLQFWAVLAAAIGYAFAADDDEVGGETGPNNATTPTAQEGDITIHYVTVGKIDHEFQNSIVAKKGDIVSFQFYPLNHSVIQAEYGYPCIPIQAVDYSHSQFYSGFFPVNTPTDNPPTWNLTINSTEPIFYYCGAAGSCNGWGMVGAINANASTSLATQIELAREADYMLLPGQQFPSEAVQASLSRLAHAATTTTQVRTTTASRRPTGSTSPNANGGSSGLSTGTVAGIAVGAAVAALIVAALFFFMRRTKKLKRRLELKTAASKVPPTWEQPGSPPTAYRGSYIDPSRPNSQLPPYQPYYHLERSDMSKPTGAENWPFDSAGNPLTSPLSLHGEGHQSPAFPPRTQNQWAGNVNLEPQYNPTVAELDITRQEMSERRM